MNWNTQQESAITSQTNHLVVIASAGAGKTEVIVQRYLRYITDHGYSPAQILAVTYTHRAAASMKQRICRILRDKKLFDEAQEAETGPIQTIHSFYERVLRENSAWTGFNPDFEIISEYESGRLWDLALRTALTKPEADQPEVRAYRQQSAGKRKWKSLLDLDSALRSEVIGNIIEPARNQNWTWQQLQESFATPTDIQKMFESSFDDPAWPSGSDSLGMKAKFFSKNPKDYKSGIELDQEVDLLIGLTQLAAITWETYESELHLRSKMDFSLLEKSALELLENNPTLAHRIRQQYKVILLDESQDANRNQFRFLRSLGLDHSLSVGDQKQSIYGFRGSAIDEFQNQIDESSIRLELNYRSQPGIINFVNHMFRNQWGTEYESMSPGKFQNPNPIDFSGVEILESSAAPARTTALFIKQMVDSGIPKQDIVMLARGRKGITQVKHHLDQMGIDCEAAGATDSLFTRMEARDMANLLTCCVHAENDYYLSCLLHSPYVGVSLDTIILLGQEPNIFNQLDSFSSPIEADNQKIQDFLEWFKEIRAFCDRYSAFEIINRALAKSPYFPNLGQKTGGERNISNARKLLVLATHHPELTPLQLADRLRHLQAVAHREPLAPLHDPDAEVVRLMTIHKSKGLEFKNVIVYGHDFTNYFRSNTIATDFRNGQAFTRFKGKNIINDHINNMLHHQEDAESMRLLYVACTRAEERLIIGSRTPGGKNKNLLLTDILLRALPRNDYPKHNVRFHPNP